ncbi:MAG: Zn-ribbon domain-containing protein [Archaeoglobaceae archaeon]
MPHQCTKCGKLFPDGDTRLLNGCDCGNNKFLYVPKGKKEKEEVTEEIKKEFLRFGIESVRIIAPGQYEINLEKLLEREEIIIALEEDGRYIIHLPSLLKKKPKG